MDFTESIRPVKYPAYNPGAITISGKDGDDANHYQERHVRSVIEEVRK